MCNFDCFNFQITNRPPSTIETTETDPTSTDVISSQVIVLSSPLLLETIFLNLAPTDIKAVSLESR